MAVDMRTCGVIFQFAFVFIILSLYYFQCTVFILPVAAISYQDAQRSIYIISFLVFMSFWCYIRACLVDPGSPPRGWNGSSNDPHSQRYCFRCEKQKPNRTHHCSVCQQCVLRMDHHCPWINNCVGHYNYKPFYLFVFYCALAAIHTCWRLIYWLYARATAHNAHEYQISVGETFLLIINGLALVLGTLGLVCLLGWHTYLIFNNATTLEYYENNSTMFCAWCPPKEVKAVHPFNVGVFNNFKSILGPNYLLWMIPTKTYGDGLSYVVNSRSSSSSASQSDVQLVTVTVDAGREMPTTSSKGDSLASGQYRVVTV
eukprot:GILJ01008617.1.p1 GENE.GILJ01008617.1~~GILJ01008617.1.p1  ORF type:complete len:315 (-),score=11.64 GILJ01008617.1:123-1067(-)